MEYIILPCHVKWEWINEESITDNDKRSVEKDNKYNQQKLYKK